MARDLKGRISRLRKLRSPGGELTPPGETNYGGNRVGNSRVSPPGEPEVNGLEHWDRPSGWVRTLTTESDLSVPVPKGYSFLLDRQLTLDDLCFMDTETTGLSGGAGTLVFLVGSGRVIGHKLRVTQTFLLDFPGEPSFLDAVFKDLWDSKTWVSYNGKAFDSKLLQTRFLMNGRSVSVPEQLDLLYWVRRLWQKEIGRCGLGDVERRILGTARDNDIPGIEIPDRYFGFLKDSDARRLEDVFSHHRQDIVSLVELYLRIEADLHQLTLEQATAHDLRIDRISLGRFLAGNRSPGSRHRDLGLELLRGAALNPSESETLSERERAALTLTKGIRAGTLRDEAESVWERLFADGSRLAGVHYAKILEHSRRDFERAGRVVVSLLEDASAEHERDQLVHRLERIRRKAARPGADR